MHLNKNLAINTVATTMFVAYELRLSKGASGYVEVRLDGDWGLISIQPSWTNTVAEVVCRQLGYNHGIINPKVGMIHHQKMLTSKLE